MMLRLRALREQLFPPGPARLRALLLRGCLPLCVHHVHIRPVPAIHFMAEHRIHVPVMTIMDPRFIPAQETNVLPGGEIDARGIKRNRIKWMGTPQARLPHILRLAAMGGRIDTPIWQLEHIPIA
jgi:hypothetical protein